MPKFAKIVVALEKFMTKDAFYAWTEKLQRCFDTLRNRLTSEPILRLHDPDLPTRNETNFSGVAIGSVMSQQHEDD